MRKVTKIEKGPLKIPLEQKDVWICMCGLSKNQPYCDGSHKSCSGEEEGKIYEYNADGTRREVTG